MSVQLGVVMCSQSLLMVFAHQINLQHSFVVCSQSLLMVFGHLLNLQYSFVVCLQSLLMVFAHLINLQLDAVLEFLTSVPGPTGKPALEFVLVEWCSRQHLFYGSYERKVRSVGPCMNAFLHTTGSDKSLEM